MTKFIDETNKQVSNKKPTQFKWLLDVEGKKEEYDENPRDYDVVKLIRRKDEDYKYDFMVAYKKGKEGITEWWILGHWNDGC